jgi:hypothetical protein
MPVMSERYSLRKRENSETRAENKKNGSLVMRCDRCQPVSLLDFAKTGDPPLPAAASAGSMRFSRGRTALRLCCSLGRRLALLHLLLLSGMLLLELLRLLSVALLHLLFLGVIVVSLGGLLVFFLLLLLELLVILRFLGS